MPRNRSKRKSKTVTIYNPKSPTLMDVLGSAYEVDGFIQYLNTYPGYVAWIEEGQIFMERYTQRFARYGGSKILMWSESKLGPVQTAHSVV